MKIETELKTVASSDLEKQVADELKVSDPSDEKAAASIEAGKVA